MIDATEDGAVELYHNSVKKFETGPAGTITVGVSTADGFRVGDSEYISVGAGGTGDMLLYHNGTDSYVRDIGTGSLILSGSRVIVKNAADNEKMIDATEDGAVELYHNSVKKFETGPAGTITVGVSTADGFEAGDDERIKLGADQDLLLYHDGANSWLINDTGDFSIRNRADDKDVLIQSDDGSGGFETYIQADGSTRAAKLFHSASVKLETTATGVTVTGTLNATTDVQINGTSAATTGKAIAMAFIFG
jgi:phage gp36-like protein